MCYTSSTSIKAFIIGVVSSLLLVSLSSFSTTLTTTKTKSYKIIGYFFLFVILMQLYDAIFWNYPPTNKSNTIINTITTKLAMITNHLQPIILGLLIYYFNGTLTTTSKMILIFYTICISIYSLMSWNKISTTSVTDRSSPSLDWEWNHQSGAPFVYFIFLVTLVLLFYQNVKIGGKLAAFLTLVSFLFSLYKYQIKASSGRFWCYFAAFAPIIFLISRLF